MPADRPPSEEHPDNEAVRRDREPVDRSPASSAVDPEHAAQDQSTEAQTGRHGYTENATYIGGELPSPSKKQRRQSKKGKKRENETDDWYKQMMDDHDVKDYPDEISPDDSTWQTLNQANRDFKATGNLRDPETDGVKQDQRDQDIANDTAAWGTRIGLTDTEINRATSLVLNAEIGGEHQTEAVILAALTIVANQGPPTYGGPHKILREERPLPDTETINTVGAVGNYVKPDEAVERYSEIRESLDIDPKTVKRCRDQLATCE